MILVDSSVWIDYFRGTSTPRSDRLDELLGMVPLAIGDLVLVEVLQGFADDKEFGRAKKPLSSFTPVDLGGHDIAIQAAKNFRALHSRGVTVHKTIDTVIATRCIQSGYTLLHSDTDFAPFVKHLGLKSVF